MGSLGSGSCSENNKCKGLEAGMCLVSLTSVYFISTAVPGVTESDTTG